MSSSAITFGFTFFFQNVIALKAKIIKFRKNFNTTEHTNNKYLKLADVAIPCNVKKLAEINRQLIPINLSNKGVDGFQ